MLNVELGSKAPAEVNVIIEIPANGPPIKYEIDKKSGMLFVDRLMSTPMYYPCNYGYIPCTLSSDGDPTDALVVTPYPLLSGSVILARPIGVLNMEDEAGIDTKILCVPAPKVSGLYNNINEPNDLSQPFLAQIRHFFTHYKDLEPNKWVKVQEFGGLQEAHAEINDSIKRYNDANK